MKRALFVLLFFFFIASAEAQTLRAFVVDRTDPVDLLDRLEVDRQSAGMVWGREILEYKMPGQVVILPDTLTIWMQHFGPGVDVLPGAANAQFIISCYPELLPPALQSKHMMRYASGLIYTYRIRQLIYISDRRIRELDMMNAYLFWEEMQ